MKNIASDQPSAGCGPVLERADANVAAFSMRQQVFEHVRSRGQAARAEITRALNISPGSATTLTADLIASGLLREVSEPKDVPSRELGRGRPRVALEVVPEAAFVIGIKLTLKVHCAVISDFAGNVVASATLPVGSKRRTTEELLNEVFELITLITKQHGICADTIGGVSIGVPGIVDQASGLIRWCSLLHERDVSLKTAFAERSKVPLFLDNDTNMLTLAELWFGAGRDKTDFAVVTIENGVGMGLVVNNQLYRGTHGIGLELGHTKVQLDGALCRCGQRGCLEAYLGDYALTREAETALDREELDRTDADGILELLFQKAKTGDAISETIFRRAGRYLSVGLANVVQLFDPPLIILSGDRMRYDYFYEQEVLSEMQKLTLSDARQPCEIEIHTWDDLVWARGATVPALAALTCMIVGGIPLEDL